MHRFRNAWRRVVAALGLGLGCAAAHGQLTVIPPEIVRPKYQVIDESYFESKFGTSFTSSDATIAAR